jgi:hypothetical protein
MNQLERDALRARHQPDEDWKPTLGFTVSWNSVVVGLVFFEFYLTWYRRFV